MWQVRVFFTVEKKNEWIKKNKYRYQIEEIAVNNGFGLLVKKLRKI